MGFDVHVCFTNSPYPKTGCEQLVSYYIDANLTSGLRDSLWCSSTLNTSATTWKCPWSLLNIFKCVCFDQIFAFTLTHYHFLSKRTCSSCSGLHWASPITLLTAYRLIPGGGWGRFWTVPPAPALPCGEEGAGRLACSFNTNLIKGSGS